MEFIRFPMIILFISSVFFGFQTFAADKSPLDPENYLYNVRDRLLGDWPEPEEWDNLTLEMNKRNCREVSCMEDYFKNVIRSYMLHPKFIGKMALKVDELLWLTPAKLTYSQSMAATQGSQYMTWNPSFYNATEELIRRVFIEDLPWDELYKSKKYKLYSPGLYGETQFYDRPYQSSYDGSTSVKSTAEELDFSSSPNAAGVFTTYRFLTRYWNSSLNQNRKRAAAVFRVMLCDSMMPSIERKLLSGQERQKALGLTEREISKLHKGSAMTAKHAADPACNKCHQRLDPLAWTMRPLEHGISKEPFKGRLRYYKNAEELTDIPVDSFGDMIQKMTEQPRYRRCQVNQLLTWVIGNDVGFSENRLLEIESKFDEVGRKPKAFVEYLLLTPEFRGQIAKADDLLIKHQEVMKVFKHCNECHGSLPLSSDLTAGKELLQKIAMKLDLKHNGANRLMPPPKHYWQPTGADLDSIKQWIGAGAPNSNGEMTLSPAEAKAMLQE